MRPPVMDSRGRALDQVSVVGLRAQGRHGVLTAERELGQVFGVDVVLHLDTRPAAATDDLLRTVHYGDLSADVLAVVTGEPVDLIETLAHRIALVCLVPEIVAAVDVTVHKPHAPVGVPVDDVTVTVRRDRGDLP